MKRQLLSIVAATSAFAAFAQLPASTSPENKKAVLEEYTGIHCGYCPDGHQIASQIYANDPDNVVLINIHAGGFAVAANGEPDFTTYVGAQLNGQFGVNSYPSGVINRSIVSGTAMACDRSVWATACNAKKAEPAYCNVALEGWIDTVSSYDPNTGYPMRILTVNAEVYYTGSSPVNNNSLSIMLLEDSIHGYQSNYGNYNMANYNADGSYNHNHVLRAMLTPGNFGKSYNTTSAGSTYTFTTTYNIPMTYGATGKETPANIYQMHLVAFVTESYKNTINAAHGTIGFRTGVFTGVKSNNGVADNINVFPNPASGLAKVRVNTGKADHVSVSVFNQVGQLVFESASKEVSAGTNDIELNTQNWASGLYSVIVKSSEGTVAKKLNVVK